VEVVLIGVGEDKQELSHEGSTIILGKFGDLFGDMFQRVSTEEQKVENDRASSACLARFKGSSAQIGIKFVY
jgi:hypothetical protein